MQGRVDSIPFVRCKLQTNTTFEVRKAVKLCDLLLEAVAVREQSFDVGKVRLREVVVPGQCTAEVKAVQKQKGKECYFMILDMQYGKHGASTMSVPLTHTVLHNQAANAHPSKQGRRCCCCPCWPGVTRMVSVPLLTPAMLCVAMCLHTCGENQSYNAAAHSET